MDNHEVVRMSEAFEMLARPIRKLLAERGFTEPTLPQREAIPKVLEGKNVLLIAPAGTGKTEAAFLPILHQMLLSPAREPGIKLVYVTPLRALNRDMLERLEWWCRSLDLRVAVRHGDTAARERRAQALIPPDVVVTTPETLQIFLLGRRLSRHLRSVQWVIIDEVHELADNKRGAQLSVTLERLRKLKGGDFQIVGLSATIGSPKEIAKFLVGVGRPCEIVDVSVARGLELEVLHPKARKHDEGLANKLYTFPDVAARLRVMQGLIESHSSTLIFTNTRPMAEILGSRFHLWDLKFPVAVHHGSLSSFTRVRAERALKAGELKGIICTSSMELGLDIGRVDLVIQYNSPRQVTRLLQRVGRSGHRIGEVSKGAIVVQDPDDASESTVIAAHSRLRKLEPVSIPEKPLDVVFHALVSMLLGRREVNLEEALETLRRAYPFRDLERGDLLEVLNFAQSLELRFLRLSKDGKAFTKSDRAERAFDYYFENLSMIPEFRQYLVMDDEKNQPVGILDESFVAEYGEPGVKFVMGGALWRIVQVFRNRVFVRSDDDPVGAIPTWIGEEIPVPFSVAQEVGRMRARIESLLRAGEKFEKVVTDLARDYGVGREAVEDVVANVRDQLEADLVVPTDETVTVEHVKGTCVVNACFGTLVNRTLARLLAYKISTELGGSVATSIDPYRILLRSESLDPDTVVEILRGGFSRDIKRDLRQIIEESKFFRWRLAQVARRMAVLKREVEFTSSVLEKLTRALRGTPAFEEAFKEVVRKDLDLEGTLEVLEKFKRGEITVASIGERKKPSPISAPVFRRQYLTFEPAAYGRLKSLAVASTKTRLLSETRTLACVSCKGHVEEQKIYELAERPRCPRCGSGELGVVEEPAEEVQRSLELLERGRETPTWRKLVESSKLVSDYGKPAAVALAGRGVSPTAAREILAKAPRISHRFLELVLWKEREAMFRGFR
jgi:ATP-dependent Lhr-like helicase